MHTSKYERKNDKEIWQLKEEKFQVITTEMIKKGGEKG